jgi:hexosaminidase
MNRQYILLFLLSLFMPARSIAGNSASGPIIPRPLECDFHTGVFMLDAATVIVISPADMMLLKPAAETACSRIRTSTGLPLPVVDKAIPGHSIVCSLDSAGWSPGPEGYSFRSDKGGIAIHASTPAGVFYGFQTLIQLLPPAVEDTVLAQGIAWSVPSVTIKDRPRFTWRGMHLDVGRHFFTVGFIKTYIDLLASYKFNTFHWHLTEDQGWRIEIKKYPLLTSVGSKRRETMGDCTPYGGYYTQEEVASVVAYAKERFITIVPEIEMPGHSLAAISAYPEYSCTGGPHTVGTEWGVFNDVYCPGREKTFKFLEDIIGEVTELFPGAFFHIGGDECPKLRWENCYSCRTLMEKEGLKTSEQLQSYFVRRIEKILNAKGKRLVGWDEILEGGLAPNATVMSWRGIDGGIAAAKSGHDVVMSPTSHCYLDYSPGVEGEAISIGGFLPLDTVYSYEPVPAVLNGDEARHIIGAQGNLWTEHIPTPQQAEYMVLPRLCAMSEVTWTAPGRKNFSDFTSRMTQHYDRFNARGVDFHIPTPAGFGGTVLCFRDTTVTLVPPVPGSVVYWTADGSDPGPASERYSKPIPVHGDMTIKAMVVLPDGRKSNPVTGSYFRVDKSHNGLAYSVYEGVWDSLPDFKKLTANGSGKVFSVGLKWFPHRKENFAADLRGMIVIPKEDDYEFFIASDDGSALFLDGKMAIDNDGLHGREEKSAKVHLTPGSHPVEVRFFQKTGGSSLDVSFSGPGIAKQFLPPAMLKPPAR